VTPPRLTPDDVRTFRRRVLRHYRLHGRDLPWRKTHNPYRILVSEIMLQQTPVARVIEKYRLFVRTFPNFKSLADAPLRDIISVWQGLGYNRRAISLKKIAEFVVRQNRGRLPRDTGELIKLPGIGPYTAAAVKAFAFLDPGVFVETNIRRVFIHCFFPGREHVPDSMLLPLIGQTLDRADPRGWYYALMDYGAMLARRVEDPNRRSAHYTRQSRFEGSDRQVRGVILRQLAGRRRLSAAELATVSGFDRRRVEKALCQLLAEGFLDKSGPRFGLA
jgi:A/G-specific adenine glycosylase